MLRISNPIAVHKQLVLQIGASQPDAVSFGVFEMSLADIQKLQKVLDDALDKYRRGKVRPEFLEAFTNICDAFQSLIEAIIEHKTQYVRVYTRPTGEDVDCVGKVFLDVFGLLD